MKDSGIEWIGEIPEGWEIIPVKYLAKYNYDTLAESCSPDFEFSYIDIGSVTYTDGITNYQNFKFKDAPSRARRIVHSGDILVSTVRTYLRAVACVNEHRLPQIASTGFLVLQADISKIHPHFLMYSVLSDNFICKVEANSVGISYPAINASQIVHFKLPIPQLSEQFLLVTYLDRQCSEIDALLSKTLSSIEEYKKLKQAVITQAVTKGVRGEREMKDCGVEWAGLVPHHWGVAKIGSIGQTSSGATPLRSKESSFFDDATIRWVRTLDLNDGFVYDSSEKITELALASSACSIMPKGTVCVAMYGGAGTIGKCGLLMSDCATNQAVCSIVCNRKIVSPIFLLMQLLALKPYWMKYAVGTRKDPNISQDIVARMKILIPPLDEQKEITDYLDAKCAEIDKLIAKKEQLVKELESYKKSLIYEVVTGKREV